MIILRLILLLLFLLPSSAWAQNPQCPTRPSGDSTNACASTAFVHNWSVAITGDCTISNLGVITCTGGSHINTVTSSAIGTITTNTSLSSTNGTVLCDATSGAVTLSLPSAAVGNLGWMFVMKKTDSSANTCTLSGTIDGASSIVLGTQYDVIAVRSNGSQWWVQ